MAITPSDIGMGMDVHGSDGEKVGSVDEITASPSGEGYITVIEGGILGIGGTHLWIPITAVERVEDGRHVTLSCTKSEASERYRNKPKAIVRDA